MPIHDWTRVDAGMFHDFHQDWTIEICRTLNRGSLAAGYFAMTDQRVRRAGTGRDHRSGGRCGVSGAAGGRRRPSACPADCAGRIRRGAYASKANRILVRHQLGPVVAVIEVVSPGNKDSRHAIRAFTAKAIEFLRSGISLVLVDLFPPTPRDPAGHPSSDLG